MKRLRLSRLGWLAGWAAAIAPALVIAVWLTGRVLSDRWVWSQWLLWIPTPAALAAGLVGLAIAARPAAAPGLRRRRLLGWSVALGAVAAWFFAVENRFLALPARGEPALRLVHSNITLSGQRALERYVEALSALDADVIVMSDPVPPAYLSRLYEALGGSVEAVTVWPFVVVTKLPIVEARPLVASSDVHVALIRLESVRLGGPVTIYAIDLPSEPGQSRAAVARRARRLLDRVVAPPPDLVVGDFNMTRGSASLREIFPGLEHAYDQAGHGYGASFHRGFPLYHIDHTFVGKRLRATSYRLVDLGMGRHLAQVVGLRAPFSPDGDPDHR